MSYKTNFLVLKKMSNLIESLIAKLRFNENGLIPAIAQDWLDGSVLMMAWMNASSIEKTIKTKEVHYWSRSRNELWHKGATSGCIQLLKDLRYDCDSDVLLLTIEQQGQGACHTGERSCFYQATKLTKEDTENKNLSSNICTELFETISSRGTDKVEGSYTNKLLDKGDDLILKKIGEESAEFIMACKDDDKESISNEAADLLFHMQVALSNHKVSWREVLTILANRRGAPRRQ